MKILTAPVSPRARTLALTLGLLMAGVSTEALAQSVCAVTPSSLGGVVCTNPTGPFIGTVTTASTTAAAAPAVTVANSGAAQTLTVGTASASGFSSSGVLVSTVGPFTLNTGTVSTTGAQSTAISVNSFNGPLVVTAANTSATGASSNGISASSSGPVTINVGGGGAGGVTATGTAISLGSGAPPVVNIAPGAIVQGGGGVFATGPGAAVNNAGTIRASAGNAVGIVSLTGSGGLNNTGRIEGPVSISGLTTPFNNAGTFAASGISTILGPFNNSGLITVMPGPLGPGTATFVGAGNVFLNNTGTIGLANGVVGDVLTLGSAANGGGTLNGGAGSQITLDVNLAANGTPSDRVVATQITGTTTVVLNPINPTAPGTGVLNPTGALIVGGAGPGTVVLQGGTIQNGFVDFTIAPAAGGFALVGSPALSAYETVKAGAFAAEYWYASADAWSGRMTEVNDVGARRQDGVEVWGHFFGSDRRFSSKGVYNAFGAPARRDLGYRQDFLGFQAGVDSIHHNGDTAVLWGGSLGFTGSDARFNANRDGAYLTGLNLGGYVGYMAGGFHANLLAKADFYDMDWNAVSAFAFDRVTGRSYGVMAETGYRFGGTTGLFLEPIASIAYVRTNIKDIRTAQAIFDFDQAKSVRGAAGLRLGTTLASGIRPFVSAEAVHEFEGDNRVVFSSGGFALPLKDNPVQTYGLVTLGIDGINLAGLNAFVRADYAFDRVHGLGLQGGVRFLF